MRYYNTLQYEIVFGLTNSVLSAEIGWARSFKKKLL